MRPKFILWGVLAFCAGCVPGVLDLSQDGGANSASDDSSVDPAQAAKAEDQRIELLLTGKGEEGDKAVPVEEFFAKLGNGYMIWKGEPAWFKKLAEEAKTAGSPAMYAVVGEAFGNTQVCAEYVITLPAEKEARAKVIEAYNQFWRSGWENLSGEEREQAEEELQSELARDFGQKYLVLNYDP